MLNFSKFVAALALGLMLSLSLLLTSSFAHTANQKSVTQTAGTITHVTARAANWGGGWGGGWGGSSWGWSSGWGGCCSCGWDGGW